MANGGRPLHRDVWAIVPIKEIVFAKQRLAKALSPARRQELAVAMFEDVMQALSASFAFTTAFVLANAPVRANDTFECEIKERLDLTEAGLIRPNSSKATSLWLDKANAFGWTKANR
jgi:Guanylyl transferase CofC like